jgi:uncharacterized protein (TIGR03067 family)
MSATAAGLAGTWNGQEDTGEPYTFVFTGTDWSLTNDAGDDWQHGTYTLNDNSNPKQLDLYITGSADNQFIAKTALFIYKIEGTIMTLTGGEPGSDYRPSDFSEGGTTRTFVVSNEDMETDDNSGDTQKCDDCNQARVYINCFVSTVMD